MAVIEIPSPVPYGASLPINRVQSISVVPTEIDGFDVHTHLVAVLVDPAVTKVIALGISVEATKSVALVNIQPIVLLPTLVTV